MLLNNLTTLPYNDSLYTFSMAIANMKEAANGNLMMPFETTTGRIFKENFDQQTVRALFFKDVISLNIVHNVTSPIVKAVLTYRDEQNLLVNFVNTNRAVLQLIISRTLNPAWANSNNLIRLPDTEEYDYAITFMVDKTELVEYRPNSAVYQLTLVSTNWFNFNNNFFFCSRFANTWESMLQGWFLKSFPPPTTLVGPPSPVLDLRGYTFGSTPSEFFTPTNWTLLDSIEYVLDRVITAENGLMFVTYNPFKNNYYLYKYSDNENNGTLNANKAANVIVLKDGTSASLLVQQNKTFDLKNNSFAGATDMFNSITGFSIWGFDYENNSWKTSKKDTNTLINQMLSVAGTPTPPGYVKKYVKPPVDPSLLPNESNRYWQEWSSSYRNSNLWNRLKSVVLENGITNVTTGGDMRRLPGSLVYLYSNADTLNYNTSTAFLGVKTVLQIEHIFTQEGYNNKLSLGSIYALSNAEIAVGEPNRA